jgi:hypothetical protein
MSVTLAPGPDPPRVLFEQMDIIDFDVAPDGRFLLVRSIPRAPLTRLVVALGASAEIGRSGG